MPLHKTAKFLNQEHTGRPIQPVIAVKFNTDELRPILFTDREFPIDILNGRKWNNWLRWAEWATTGATEMERVGDSGLSRKTANASGVATVILDSDYPVRYRELYYLVDSTDSADTTKIYVRSGSTIAELTAASYTEITRSGDSIAFLEPAQYLQIKVEMTGIPGADPAKLRYVEAVNETQEQHATVLSYGTISADLTQTRGVATAGIAPRFRNHQGEFSELAAKYNWNNKDLSIVLAPAGAMPKDFVTVFTGSIEGWLAGEDGTLDASKTRLAVMGMFQKLKTTDFGRQTGEFLPYYFGDQSSALWCGYPTYNITNQETAQLDLQVYGMVAAYVANENFTLTWDPDARQFVITASSTSLEEPCVCQIGKEAIIRDVSGNVMFRLIVTRKGMTWLLDGDTITFSTYNTAEAEAVRIDAGGLGGNSGFYLTTEDNQVWACSGWPVYSIDSLYDEDGLISTTNYTAYPAGVYRQKKFAYVQFKNSFTPNGTVKWAGKGFVYNGEMVTNPAAIALGCILYDPTGKQRLEDSVIDYNSFYDCWRWFNSQGITYKGSLSKKDQTYQEVLLEICQYIAEVELSEGRFRILPFKSQRPGTMGVRYWLRWDRELASGIPPVHPSNNSEIMSKLRVWYGMEWGQRKKRYVDLISARAQAEYGTRPGYGKTVGAEIELPFATAAGAKTIGQNWLDYWDHTQHFVELPCCGLEQAVAELGDREFGFVHPYVSNPNTGGKGTAGMAVEIVGKRFDLDGKTVTLIGRMGQDLGSLSSILLPGGDYPEDTDYPLIYDDPDSTWEGGGVMG